MKKSQHASMRAGVLALMLTLLLGGRPAAGQTRAQWLLQPPVTSADMDMIVRTLSLDGEREAAARRLFDTYAQAYAKDAATYREALERYERERHAANLSRQHENELTDERWRAGLAIAKRRVEAERELLADIRSLLTNAEAGTQWPAVERARRRAWLRTKEALAGRALAWTRIDLVAEVDKLGLNEQQTREIGPTLEAYGLDADEPLKKLAHAWEEDDQKLEAVEFDEHREAGLVMAARALKGVNKRYFSILRAALPAPAAAELEAAVRPKVCAEVLARGVRQTPRLIEFVEKMDLDDAQRQRLAEVKARYKAEKAAKDKGYMDVYEHAESEQDAMSPGEVQAATSQARAEGRPSPLPWDKADASFFKDREAFEGRMMAAVRDILTPAQLATLPEEWTKKGYAAAHGG